MRFSLKLVGTPCTYWWCRCSPTISRSWSYPRVMCFSSLTLFHPTSIFISRIPSPKGATGSLLALGLTSICAGCWNVLARIQIMAMVIDTFLKTSQRCGDQGKCYKNYFEHLCVQEAIIEWLTSVISLSKYCRQSLSDEDVKYYIYASDVNSISYFKHCVLLELWYEI